MHFVLYTYLKEVSTKHLISHLNLLQSSSNYQSSYCELYGMVSNDGRYHEIELHKPT